MTTIEKDDMYAYISEQSVGKEMFVYIDSSYKYEPKLRSHEAAAFGTGWSIKNPTNGRVIGYGAKAVWDAPVNDSSVAEMKGILAFLDTLRDHFPKILGRLKMIRIFCDNQMLMSNIHMNFVPKKPTEKCPDAEAFGVKRYGKDYFRFQEYAKTIRIQGRWVKGHNNDSFNCLADKLASSTFQSMISTQQFYGKRRRHIIHQQLVLRKMIPTPNGVPRDLLAFEGRKASDAVNESTAKKPLGDYVSLFVGAQHSTSIEGTHVVSSLAYTCPDFESYGHTIEEHPKGMNNMAIRLRAFSFALFSYRMSDDFDPQKQVIIYSSMKIAISFIHEAINGREQDVLAGSKELNAEFNNLQTMMSGMRVGFLSRPASGKAAHVTSLAAITSEAYFGRVSEDDLEYKKRIEDKLDRSFQR